MPDRTPAAAGRSAARRGQTWQRRCATTARLWFPNAEHVGRFPPPGAGDILNIGDRIIEATVQPLSSLAAKLRQAEGDAATSDFGEYWVWKAAAGQPIERSYMISHAGVVLPLLARLDKLDQWEAEQEATRP